MMRVLFSALVVVSLLLAGLPVGAQQPGVGFSILQDGSIINGTFEGATSAHIYAFNASMGDNVFISMSSTSPDLDPFLVLLGSRGEVLTSDDDAGGNRNAFIGGFPIPQNGAYFILASSFNYVDDILIDGAAPLLVAQSYDLSITGIRQPVGVPENQVTYFRTILPLNTPFEGQSTPEEPVYYFVFEGRAGQILDITLESAAFDPLLQVFGAGSGRLAVNDDDPQIPGNNSAIRRFSVPQDGLYLILATDVFFYNAQRGADYTGGSFNITVRQVG